MAAVALAVIAAILAARRSAEPALLGQPVSYWVLGWRHAQRETPESVLAAYAAMDGSHVRWLRGQLGWRPSWWRGRVARLFGRFGIPVGGQTPDDYREQAATALGRLGERATSAIPDLRATSVTEVEPRAQQARLAARAALVNLGVEPLGPVLARARSPGHPDWYAAADVLARLEGQRRQAGTIFSEIMHGAHAPGVRCRAIQLYRISQPPVAEAVSNLSRALLDRATRDEALAQLGMMGGLAASATQAVAEVLADANPTTRRLATNAWVRLGGR